MLSARIMEINFLNRSLIEDNKYEPLSFYKQGARKGKRIAIFLFWSGEHFACFQVRQDYKRRECVQFNYSQSRWAKVRLNLLTDALIIRLLQSSVHSARRWARSRDPQWTRIQHRLNCLSFKDDDLFFLSCLLRSVTLQGVNTHRFSKERLPSTNNTLQLHDKSNLLKFNGRTW